MKYDVHYIQFECDCPICGNIVKKFITPDARNNYLLSHPQEVTNFNGKCKICKFPLNFKLDPDAKFRLDSYGKEALKKISNIKTYSDAICNSLDENKHVQVYCKLFLKKQLKFQQKELDMEE